MLLMQNNCTFQYVLGVNKADYLYRVHRKQRHELQGAQKAET